MATWVDIDRAYSTPNGVFAPLSDVRGPIEVGDVVHVKEKASGLTGGALVTSVDEDNAYLSLAWNTLTDAYSARGAETGYRHAKLIPVRVKRG
jgi:hypothetical protein